MATFSAGASLAETTYCSVHLSSTTWVVPETGMYVFHLVGGGGGGSGGNVDSPGNCVGAGGAGATLVECRRQLRKGIRLTITIGAGGVGGNSQTSGNAGGSTIVTSTSEFYWIAPGGRGGSYHATDPTDTGADSLFYWGALTGETVLSDMRLIPGGFGAKAVTSGLPNIGGAVGQPNRAMSGSGLGASLPTSGGGSNGGDSFYGIGGVGVGGGNGGAGNVGGGGAGGYFAKAGGSGGQGVVIIWKEADILRIL